MKLFLALLIAVSAQASEPEFHYQDCVKIVSGFYMGCKGKVNEMDSEDPADVQYRIDMFCKGRETSKDIKASLLKPAKDCKEQ